jgi:hypothetical protein
LLNWISLFVDDSFKVVAGKSNFDH